MEEFEIQEELNLCVGLLKEKLEDVSLRNLEEFTISFEKEDVEDTIEYDKQENVLAIELDQFSKKSRDAREQDLMKGLLSIVTTDKETKKSGITFDGKMEAFNRGITCQLANALIPSEETSLKDFECSIVADFFTSIVSRDKVYDAYFHQDGEMIYNDLLEKLGNKKDYLDTILTLADFNMTTLQDNNQPSLLGYLQESVSKIYIDNNKLTIEELEEFREKLFTEAEYAPEGGVSRLLSCATCDGYVQQKIEEEKQKTSRVSRMAIKRENDLRDMIEGEMMPKKETRTVRRT